MEKKAYGGWPNCITLSNGKIEAVVTTDVGPRVIRLGFVGGQNLFKEYEDMLGTTGGDEWKIYGGHRLWHAPEAKPRTYALDNVPVEFEWDGTTLRLTPPFEADNGVQKEMLITMDPDENKVTVLHRITNESAWDITLAPWALSVMAQTGRAILPQEPFVSHQDKLLPARPLVLWNYTNMSDPRWTWGEKYVQLQQDPNNTQPQKIGIRSTLGWVAYALNGDVFIKRYPVHPDAEYPDYGSNTETFTNEDMLEVETLGPLTNLEADGGSVEHTERWYLFKADVGTDDEAIDATLMPLVAKTK